MASVAIDEALDDAGCTPGQVGEIYFGNTVQGATDGQHMVRGQVALLPLGFQGTPIFNVESACATGSSAFHLAVKAIRAGAADVVLAVAAEKMVSDDRVQMMALFDSGWDVERANEAMAEFESLAGTSLMPQSSGSKDHSIFMDIYAALARSHMHEYGTTQRQLAAIAAKNHVHSQYNPKAQFRRPMTPEEVLSGRALTFPLTVPMCAPISDGAAAAVLCSPAGLASLSADSGRAVRVRASVLRSATERGWSALDAHIGRLAALAAYEEAGLGAHEIDVVELHDATAFSELMLTESLGLCPRGEGGVLAESGATSMGGHVPVNPSGGLECKGHPVAATGLGQIYELVLQLRGEAGPRQVEGARIALQENGGGIWGYEEASTHVGILERN